MRYRPTLYPLLLPLLLAACADDGAGTDGTVDVLRLEGVSRNGMVTRAIDGAVGGIGLYMTTTDKGAGRLMRIDHLGVDADNNDQWRSMVSVETGTQYYIYGFMPADAASSVSISAPSGGTFAEGATLTLGGVDAVTTSDVCALVAVQDMASATEAENLIPGQFSYKGKSKEEGNHMRLLMGHLFAALELQLAVEDTYNQLRRIRLRSVQLEADGAATVTITAQLTATPTEPLQVSTATSGTSASALLVESASGLLLTTEPQTVTGFYMPKLATNLTLTCTYDVYDRNNDQLVRQGCTATNRLSGLSGTAGEMTVLTVTIRPTYLYQLSDQDLDNPTIHVTTP